MPTSEPGSTWECVRGDRTLHGRVHAVDRQGRLELVDELGQLLIVGTAEDLVARGWTLTGPGATPANDEALPTSVHWHRRIAAAAAQGVNVMDPRASVPIALVEVVDVLNELAIAKAKLGAMICDGCQQHGDACACAGECVVCGCDQEHACEGGCSWADESHTVCTSCVDRHVLEELGAGARP
jgi:hypothetical protein